MLDFVGRRFRKWSYDVGKPRFSFNPVWKRAKVKAEWTDRTRMVRFKVKAENTKSRAGNVETVHSRWKKALLGDGKVCSWRVRTRCFIKYGRSRPVQVTLVLLRTYAFGRSCTYTRLWTYARESNRGETWRNVSFLPSESRNSHVGEICTSPPMVLSCFLHGHSSP